MSDRLAELREKENLTTDELDELIALSPPGSFLVLPNWVDIGIIDVSRAFQNFEEGPARSRKALENGCYVEVLALRVQHAEFWLRMYWVAQNQKGRIFEAKDKRTFGMIINDCAQLGFPPSLISRLQDFNAKRIDVVHKYLLGATGYDDLRIACEQHQGLDREVQQHVNSEIGVPALKAQDLLGNSWIRRDPKTA